MKVVSEFEKVSFNEFKDSIIERGITVSEEVTKGFYDSIKLPERGTSGSAGYDFYSPFEFVLNGGDSIMIPTGIRCKMKEDWVLAIFPRSGLGCKHRLQLDNTVGIIDSDYYYSDNEGHIMLKITNDSKDAHSVLIKQGQGIAQGIFLPFGVTYSDCVETERNGGFGSTDK